MPALLDIHDVTVAYHRRPVVWDVDLTLEQPQLAAIVGPNGAGKSTLMKAALGLVPMASGRVQVFGQPVAKVRRRIGYVPQRESVDWDFPVSVLDVVLMTTGVSSQRGALGAQRAHPADFRRRGADRT